jgi:hypothetical protein
MSQIPQLQPRIPFVSVSTQSHIDYTVYDIRTGYLPHTSLESYRHTSLLGGIYKNPTHDE